MAFTVGIDLGTTNTVVSTARRGINDTIEVTTENIPQIGEDGFTLENSQLLPSVLSVVDGFNNVGLVARAMKGQNNSRVISNSKNFIGQGEYSWEIDGKEYTPEIVASYFLSAVKNHLIQMYNDPKSLESVVITVPASFNIDQRNATKTAAKLAGFGDDITLISEPTASILDFINEQSKLADIDKFKDLSTFKNILVFDIGGGTTDVAILKIKINGKEIYVEEIAVSPHTLLGGTTFDAYATEGIIKDYEQENNLNLIDTIGKENYIQLKGKLLVLLEKAKMLFTSRHFALKTQGKTEEEIEETIVFPVQIPNIINGNPFVYNLSMKKYNGYISGLLKKDNGTENIIKPMEETLHSCGYKTNDIDYVFCVGGMSKYPAVWSTISNYFEKEPLKFADSMHSVSRGAAIYSYYEIIEAKSGEDLKEIDIVPTVPQTVYLNVKNDFPFPLIEAKTKAGTPVIHENLIEVTSEIGTTLELYTGMNIFDPNLKKLESIRLQFPYGIPKGSKLTLKLDFTQKGLLNFEAFVKNHPEIKVNVALEGSLLSNEEVEIVSKEYRVNEVRGVM